jgi:hemoglobin
MLSNTIDRETVDKMVRAFYTKILADEMVGPYFVKRLGPDITSGRWHEHLNTLNDFWMLMMTGRAGYGGHPFPSHATLGQMYRETFDRWLELFHETVYEFFVPEIAEAFYKKSQILAEQFIDYLGIDDEDDDW